MKRLLCKDCQRVLVNDEIALNLKLRNRSIGTFYCLGCFSKRFDLEKNKLTEMAAFFKENGCELFTRRYVNEQGSEHA